MTRRADDFDPCVSPMPISPRATSGFPPCEGTGAGTDGWMVDFKSAAVALDGSQTDAWGSSHAGLLRLSPDTVNCPGTASGETPPGDMVGIVYYDSTLDVYPDASAAFGQPTPYFCGQYTPSTAADACAPNTADNNNAWPGRTADTVAGCECWTQASPPPPPVESGCVSTFWELDETAGVCAGAAWPGCLVKDLRDADFEGNGVCEDGFGPMDPNDRGGAISANDGRLERTPTRDTYTVGDQIHEYAPTSALKKGSKSAYFLLCDASATQAGYEPDVVVGTNVVNDAEAKAAAAAGGRAAARGSGAGSTRR